MERPRNSAKLSSYLSDLDAGNGADWHPVDASEGEGGSDSESDAREAVQSGREGEEQEGRKRGRRSVRQRNNKRVQEFTDTPRLRKRLEIRFGREDWDSLLQAFQLAPGPAWDPEGGAVDPSPSVAQLRAECAPGDATRKRPPSLKVDGLVIGTRWVRMTSEPSQWQGDSLDITDLGLEPSPGASRQEFQALVDCRVRELLARQELVTLALVVHVKLKVELFEMTLPAKRSEAHAIHSYAGPALMKGRLKTIPSYVPADKFLNLNASESRCWVARTSFKKGNMLTKEFQVGPDHCFQPGEIVSFRIQSKVWRFRTPVWVISEAEQEAFERLYANGKCKEGFLVKDTLNSGDRFVLMPCFDRVATRRPDWRRIRETELVADIVEEAPREDSTTADTANDPQRDPDCGYITRKLVKDFALDKLDPNGNPKEVRVVHVDCHWLNIRLSVPAFIGVPNRATHDVSAPPPPGLALHDVNHYMDLRGRLGFNAMGLLHKRDDGSFFDDGVGLEVPLGNNSVMLPKSQLLFMDHWRDTQEQKAFRRVLDTFCDADFLLPIQHA